MATSLSGKTGKTHPQHKQSFVPTIQTLSALHSLSKYTLVLDIHLKDVNVFPVLYRLWRLQEFIVFIGFPLAVG